MEASYYDPGYSYSPAPTSSKGAAAMASETIPRAAKQVTLPPATTPSTVIRATTLRHQTPATAGGPSSAAPLFSRVKVAVRCRPPFEEEGLDSSISLLPPTAPLQPSTVAQLPADLQQKVTSAAAAAATVSPRISAAQPGYALHVTAPAGSAGSGPQSQQHPHQSPPHQQLTTREFAFDAVFGPAAGNHDVYNAVAGPIVESVLNDGVNGTVICYGQTGSGKTHTLGTLTRVKGENGIIPRALSHIFGTISLSNAKAQAQAAALKMAASSESSAAGVDGMLFPRYQVSLSFCQLYLDGVYDLLSPTSFPAPSSSSANSNMGSPMPPGSSGASTPYGASHPRSGSVTPASTAFSSSAASMGSTSHTRSRSANGRRRAHGSSGGSGNGGGSSAGGAAAGMTPLAIREDSLRGVFYVEGQTEYAVSSFAEAVDLLDWGLENRILGATRMNATSSRSHTILTVKIEARLPVRVPTAASITGTGAAGVQNAYITRSSQLMLVDLAGSERVRRTSSRGMRLEEARAINASLHTLGQVIVALSSSLSTSAPPQYCPWRDSKLTKLLHGHIGGTSHTVLIATVSPALNDAQESLSTLQFASRCMRVAASPISNDRHSHLGRGSVGGMEAGQYQQLADLATRLQAKLCKVEGDHAMALAALQDRYERTVADLSLQLQQAHHQAQQQAAQHQVELQAARAEAAVSGGSSSHAGGAAHPDGSDATVTQQLYSSVQRSYNASLAALLWALYRAGQHSSSWEQAIERARHELPKGSSSSSSAVLAALTATHQAHASNSIPLLGNSSDGQDSDQRAALALVEDSASSSLLAPPSLPRGAVLSHLASVIVSGDIHSLWLDKRDPRASPDAVFETLKAALAYSQGDASALADASLVTHSSVPAERLAAYAIDCERCTVATVARLNALAACKDARYDELKRSVASLDAALRAKEEDAASQRGVMAFITESASALRQENSRLREKLGLGAASPSSLALPLPTSATGPSTLGSGSGRDSNATSLVSSSSFFRDQGTIVATAPAVSASDASAVVAGTTASDDDGSSSFTGDDTPVVQTFHKLPYQPESLSPRLPPRSSPSSALALAPLASSPPKGGKEAIAAAVETIEALASRPPSKAQVAAAAVPVSAAAPPVIPATAPLPLSRPASSGAIGKPPLPPSSSSSLAAPPALQQLLRQAVSTQGAAARPMVGPVSDGDDHADEDHGAGGGEVEAEADAEGEDEDEIECIVGHRYILPSTSSSTSSSAAGDSQQQSQQPRLLYCVHWKGSNPDGSEDEYFDRDDLLRDYPLVVRRYEEERRRRAMQQQ